MLISFKCKDKKVPISDIKYPNSNKYQSQSKKKRGKQRRGRHGKRLTKNMSLLILPAIPDI